MPKLGFSTDWLHRAERLISDSDLLGAIAAAQREIGTADLDLSRVRELACSRAQQLTGAEGAAVGVLQADKLILQAACGMLASVAQSTVQLPRNAETLNVVATEVPACDVSDLLANAKQDICRSVGARSGMDVPLIDGTKIIGLLLIVSSHENAFNERACHTLELLSSFVAAAVSHAAAFQQQVEEKKRTEDALQMSEKVADIGRHAASIAHEIKNPLESLSNLLYLLEQDPTLDQTARTYVQWSQQELRRAVQISQQTLAFSKEDADRVNVSILSVLDKVLEFYSHKIRYKGITVDKRYDTDTEIKGFPGELRQVFSNLLVNAMEAVPIGRGRLTLHAYRSFHRRNQSMGTRVLIADNGPGIHPDHTSKIFEPFFTTKQKGTGLGLWITKRLVHKHGGSIRFRSRFHPERGGTCFVIFLPSNGFAEPHLPA